MQDDMVPPTPENSSNNSHEPREFSYETFTENYLLGAEDFSRTGFSIAGCEITEFGSSRGDGSQVYAMTSFGSLPVLKIAGDVVTANVTPSLAQRNRVPDRPLRMDRYLLRMTMSSKEYQQALRNASKVIEFWKKDENKLFDISLAGKHQNTKEQFQKEGLDVVFHGLTTPNEFVFTKSVGVSKNIDSKHPLHTLLPTIEEQSLMRKLAKFSWNTKIPIFNEEYKGVNLVESPIKGKSAEVYFQINQLFYGEKIRLQPEIVGVQVMMSEILESPQKKARRSALF